MRSLSFTLILAFTVTALALTITSPGYNDKIDFSEPVTMRWTSVESDPKNFTIVLVNMNGLNVRKDIAENVETSKNSYTIESVEDIPKANGYQINLIASGRENTGILAQSQVFNVTGVSNGTRTTETPSATASETASSSTGTNAAGTVVGSVPGSVLSGVVMGLVALGL